MHPTLLLLCGLLLATLLPAQAPYVAAPDAPHQVVLVVDRQYGDVIELGAEVARYQAKHYADTGLRSKAIRLIRQPEQFAIQVTGFANEAAALRYTARIEQRRPDFARERMLSVYFPISFANFAHLYRAQSVAGYAAFARRRYAAE